MRLRFHLGPEGAVWYLRSAGSNHVMVDPQAPARALAAGFVRPVELWRSPRWERPASVSVVRYSDSTDSTDSTESTDPTASTRSEPPDAPSDLPARREPGLANAVGRAAVVDFVGDVSAFRLGALGALIDAVAAALDGGPPVVLAGGDAEEAAAWIGAVSFFAPPFVCLRLSFSTFERLDDVLSQLARDREDPGADPGGWHTPVLSVVPYEDVDRLSRRDELPVVVIDPRVEATLGALGGVEHRQTPLGQRITVTDWSRLALDACCEDFTVLERCLAAIDRVSVGGGAPEGRADWWPAAADAARRSPQAAGPAWALAAAVALTGGMQLALPTATRVLLRDTPPGLPLPSELAATLTSLVSATVDDAEQAWARLAVAREAEPVRPALVQAARESYLRLAGDDETWLLRAPVPLPALAPDAGLAGRLTAPLRGMVERLAAVSGAAGGPDAPGAPDAAAVRQGLLRLRALDFAHRVIGAVGGPHPGSVEEGGIGLARLGARAAADLLDPDAGERIAEVAGAVDAGALARWVLPPVNREQERWPGAANPVGQRLPAPVTALLARGIDAGRLAGSAPELLGHDPVGLEVAVAGAAGRITGDARLRRPALEHLLHTAAAAYPDADPAALVAEVFGRLRDDEPWSGADLLQIVQRAPAALGPHLVPVALGALADWIDDPESGRLAAALLKRVEFLPRRGGDGRPRPRRAGTTNEEAQLLNLLAATGPGWLTVDDGLNRRAAEILMWADRAWPAVDQRVRELIAPRVTVAAFQVALAAEPAQAGVPLRARLAVVPTGSAWVAAVPLGLERALPQLHEVLRLNRYRMAGELVEASTRAMLEPSPPGTDQAAGPRLPRLPVGPVVRSLVAAEPSGDLREHLAVLVDQRMQAHEGSIDERGLVGFWEAALPGATLHPHRPALTPRAPAPGSALAVALGDPGRPADPARLAQLIALEPPPAEGAGPARWWSTAPARLGALTARWRRWRRG